MSSRKLTLDLHPIFRQGDRIDKDRRNHGHLVVHFRWKRGQ